MTVLFHQAPARLIVGVIVVAGFFVLLSASLGWHALLRARGTPRVPLARTTYVLAAVVWAALIAALGMAVVIVFLLRDNRAIDGRTPLAELRCETVSPGHLRAELTTRTSRAPEQYDLRGESCAVSVLEVNLRPSLRIFGVRELSRVEGMGPLERPRANPDWLTPHPSGQRRLLNLVVQGAHRTWVAVPPSREKRTLVASPNGGQLELINS
jgi:hypothetical protein